MAFIGNQIITINSLLDLDGQELVLDADADSTIHVSTDDQIDFKIGGTDVVTFTNSSSDFVITQAVQDKDIIFKGDDGGSAITALTLDMSEAGNASFNGTVTANAGVVVDNITIDGTEIDLSSGNLTIDVAGGIILDTDAGELQVHDGGTEYVQFKKDSSNVQITAGIQDGDIVFRGNDGGSMIEAMRIDISEGGDLLINKTSSDAGTAGHELLDYGRAVHTATATTVQVVNRLSSDGDIAIFQKDGSTVGAIASSSGDLLIDAPADIILDADGSEIILKDGGTEFLKFQKDGTDAQIRALGSDGDIIFIGNDGGSDVEMGRFDSSLGGEFRVGTASGNPGSGDNGIIMVPENGILITGASAALRIYSNTSGSPTASITAAGALSKASGSFKINHPLESKKDTHYLVHSFIEGPQADLIYRGKVTLSSGTATVNIDTVSGMTEGTFVALNTDVQCFTSNESGWTAIKGSISGNTLTITAQDNSCTDTISWMVIGERHDPHMKDGGTDWTDSDGKVILEPEKESE